MIPPVETACDVVLSYDNAVGPYDPDPFPVLNVKSGKLARGCSVTFAFWLTDPVEFVAVTVMVYDAARPVSVTVKMLPLMLVLSVGLQEYEMA